MITLNDAGKAMLTVLNWVEDLLAYFSGILLIFLALATAFDVASRSLSNWSAPWVVEVSEIGMVYATFFSAAWILRLNGHVALDTVVNLVSLQTRRVFTIIAMSFAFVSLLIITWSSTGVAADAYERKLLMENVLSIPRWLALVPIPAGSLLLAIECMRQMVLAIQGGDHL